MATRSGGSRSGSKSKSSSGSGSSAKRSTTKRSTSSTSSSSGAGSAGRADKSVEAFRDALEHSVTLSRERRGKARKGLLSDIDRRLEK